MGKVQTTPLSALARFHIYGVHGFATEIMFTAIWEFVVNLNWKYPGNSSIWSFFIYGLNCMVLEQMMHKFKGLGIPLPIRGIFYALWTYGWEFSTGWVLRQFDACPWDYTPFDGDFMGLITLEYAPGWYLGGIFVDQIMAPWLLSLRWSSTETSENGTIKHKVK